MVYDNNGRRLVSEMVADEDGGFVAVEVALEVVPGATLNGQPIRYEDWQ
jgi:hypothetical protein